MTDAREEIVEHLSAMRAFAMSLTRNSALADDMVQDALVKAWTKIDSYQPGTNMRAWLFTILRNTYYSHHRKARREVADVDGEMAASLAQKPDHDGRLQMRDFNRAFDQLNDEQREALVLVGARRVFLRRGRRDLWRCRRHDKKPCEPRAQATGRVVADER